MIKQEIVDKILDAARIEEVVGDFVQLKKRGTSLIGLCPFHNEKTPSFNVSVSKGIFKCFGCGQGGDAVRFIMEHEKYSYPEALKYLANKYQIQIEEEQQSDAHLLVKDHRERLLALSSWAGKFFMEKLWEDEDGRAIGLSYFKERGYREDIIRKFGLGYSPEAWDALYTAAKQETYADDILEETGLIVKKDQGKHYDRFRSRVMFPIHNLTGRIIGFGGRTLKTEKNVPKYVNSPESLIYQKSQLLYGLYFAKKAISATDNCYLVEGYADVIAMHQCGIEQVVSSSGTSLTEEQVRLIGRYTKNVTILYDGDDAGIKASLRGTDMLLKEGLNVKVLLFPEGDDPDSFARKHGATQFAAYLKEKTQDFIFFKTKVLLRDTAHDPLKKATVVREVLDSIALIPDEIKIAVFMKEVSVLLDVDERALVVELNKIRKHQQQTAARKITEENQDAYAREELVAESQVLDATKTSGDSYNMLLQERELVRLLLNYGNKPAHWIEGDTTYPIAIVMLLETQDIVFEDAVSKQIIDVYLRAIEEEKLPTHREFIHHQDKDVADLAVLMLSSPYQLSPNWNDDKRKIHVPAEEDKLKNAVNAAVFRLKKQHVTRQIITIRQALKTASADEEPILLHKYGKLKEMEKALASYLGSVVVK